MGRRGRLERAKGQWGKSRVKGWSRRLERKGGHESTSKAAGVVHWCDMRGGRG